MYESFFQLQTRPFLASPIADRYYPSSSIEHARETLSRCIDRGEGPAVVLGPAGTGKSTLCQVLAGAFRERFHVATLASARLCTRRALLQNILFELKLPYRDREEGELRLALIDFLDPSETCPNGMLLIVDEAHMLPLRLLEEIRMITNLVRDGEPRVRLVMAASMVLDERLAAPRLESFNQRIAARCYLQSMNRDETCGYIRAQMATACGQPDTIFTDDALHAVYRATDGIPRLVNQVCDHVLMMAAIGRRETIDAAGVEEAWADLQQLPTPWTSDADAPSASGSEILEFGELDDAMCGELGSHEPDSQANNQVVSEAAERLDEIETGIAAIADEDASAERPVSVEADDTQFRPRMQSEPEIELVFHHAHNPFNERFEEEEVIVDPVASLETLDGSGRRAPTASDEREQPTIPIREQLSTDVPINVGAHEALLDPILPDFGDEDRGADEGRAEDHLPGDDRDLLVIHDDASGGEGEVGRPAGPPKPRRREYRQLFATLRRR